MVGARGIRPDKLATEGQLRVDHRGAVESIRPEKLDLVALLLRGRGRLMFQIKRICDEGLVFVDVDLLRFGIEKGSGLIRKRIGWLLAGGSLWGRGMPLEDNVVGGVRLEEV